MCKQRNGYHKDSSISAKSSCPISLKRAQPECNIEENKLHVPIPAHIACTHLAFSVKAFADGVKGRYKEAWCARELLVVTGR